jgi:hypothetical protein
VTETVSDRLRTVFEKIDAFNAADPRKAEYGGTTWPYEAAYARRLTDWVLRLKPDASEPLRAAAWGQHVGRWTVPRDSYPEGRGGYLRWREALKVFHARTVCGFMADAGFDPLSVARAEAIVRKRDLTDPDTQILEDALCLVFLETQFEDLRRQEPPEKMKEIVRKTWRKMGPAGRAAALTLNLPPDSAAFLKDCL